MNQPEIGKRPKYSAFYIRPSKTWAAYRMDETGNQIGPVGYGETKSQAVDDAEREYINEKYKEYT